MWTFSQSENNKKVFLAPADMMFNHVLAFFFYSQFGSTQVEYTISMNAPPIILGTTTSCGLTYIFARMSSQVCAQEMID